MSLFANHLFGSAVLGQTPLPEPASDALIRELATTGGSTPSRTLSRTVEPAPTPDAHKPSGSSMLPSPGATWVPYAAIGGSILFVGALLWAATRRAPTANRRRRRSRRRAR
jgi:hypothetical protein